MKSAVKLTSTMLSAISFGVFCRRAPSIIEIIRSRNEWPGFGGDTNNDAVAEDARAASDGAAVAAAFANDRRGLAGNGGFVHGGDAFHDFTVGGNHVAGLANKQVTDFQLGTRHRDLIPLHKLAGHRFRAHLAQRVGVRLAAAFGHRFRKVGEQAGEPQPGRRFGC